MDKTSEHLTRREHEVLELLVSGCSTKGVAFQLRISLKTAATHRANIMKKLGVHETASMVRKAILWGLVVLDPKKQLAAGADKKLAPRSRIGTVPAGEPSPPRQTRERRRASARVGKVSGLEQPDEPGPEGKQQPSRS